MIIALQPQPEMYDSEKLQRFIKIPCAVPGHLHKHRRQLLLTLTLRLLPVSVRKPNQGVYRPLSVFVGAFSFGQQPGFYGALVVRAKIGNISSFMNMMLFPYAFPFILRKAVRQ